MATSKLDPIDRRILAELQADGRMTNVELASRVGISAPPYLRRVRTLEESLALEGPYMDDAYGRAVPDTPENQARLIRSGRAPDNFLAPYDLSDFERSHLRDAFVVVRTMQSAVGQSRGARN